MCVIKRQSETKPSRANTVKTIRRIMGRTQKEMASAFGISEKAVQSYEQGWRKVPVRVMIQLLVLLALYRKQTIDDAPCWEIRNCSPPQREKCASFTVGHGQFCWFVGSKECHPYSPASSESLFACMDCPVIQRLLTGKRTGSTAS